MAEVEVSPDGEPDPAVPEDEQHPGTGHRTERPRHGWWVALYLLLGLVALCTRAFLLRFSGLTGEGTYDDGVHFAGSLALVMGKLPYRDFLFLHPPMSLIALSPFAALARVASESLGFSVARVAWMLLGVFNATAVARLLRPLGMPSALVGGLAYALYFPAAYTESTTMLEALGNTFLLASLLLLVGRRSPARLAWAGLLLGLLPTVKIWGVAVVAVVVIWVWVTRGARAFLTVLVSSVLSCFAVLLPFFIASPLQMWDMVVAAQLGRPSMATSTLEERIWVMLGLYGEPISSQLAYVLAGVGLAVAAVSVWRNRTFDLVWLALALALSGAGMLVFTPSFYWHYPALIAAPLSILLGAAVTIAPRVGNRIRWLGAAAILPVVLAWGIALGMHDRLSFTGRDMQYTPLLGAVASTGGCVTSDDPAALIELNVFDRNIARGCPVWIDLTGHSYLDMAAPGVSRAHNVAFQRRVIGYLASGEVAIIGRQDQLHYLGAQNRREIESWLVLAQAGTYTAYLVRH